MPIVQAVGIACGNSLGGSFADASRIADAMLNAVRACHVQGIIDPLVIRARMAAAREFIVSESQS